MNDWIQSSEDAERPVLVTVNNADMGAHFMIKSKYGEFDKKLPTNLVNNPNTEVKVEFVD